jgi:protein TonB
VQLPALVSRKDPVYPYAARAARIQDVVVLEGVVGTNGRVRDLRAISGRQVFWQAAIDAVGQWVYKPAMLNGTAIEARVRVEIRFREGM